MIAATPLSPVLAAAPLDVGLASGPPRAAEGARMPGARAELSVVPAQTDMPRETALSVTPDAPPSWSPGAESVFSTTLRGGIPPMPVEARPTSGHSTLLPDAELHPPSELGAVVGRVVTLGDLQLDVMPALTPAAPAGPPPPPPLAAAPVPAPSSGLPTFQARPADEFMQAFLGAAEPVSDGGDDDLFAAPAPPPPPPWPLIGAVAAVIVALGLYSFRDSLFGAETEPEPAPVAEPEVPEAKAPPEPPPPPPETKLAEAKAEPKPVPPAPTDPAFAERLAKAKAAYKDGKLKATAAALADLSQQAPEHPEVLLLTAQVQLEEGKMVESRTTADKCVAVDPGLADCWLTLGVLRQHVKDAPGAVIAYETYLKLAPTGRYARAANSQLARLRTKGI